MGVLLVVWGGECSGLERVEVDRARGDVAHDVDEHAPLNLFRWPEIVRNFKIAPGESGHSRTLRLQIVVEGVQADCGRRHS